MIKIKIKNLDKKNINININKKVKTMGKTSNILSFYFPSEIVRTIQEFNLPFEHETKKIFNKQIKAIETINNEMQANRYLHEYFEINLSNLSFVLYHRMSMAQLYHSQNILKNLEIQRAHRIINERTTKDLLYRKETQVMQTFICRARTIMPPMTKTIASNYDKLDDRFISYLKDELCNAITKRTNTKYHMCCNKKAIKNNKISPFCKIHSKKNIKDNTEMVKKNINLVGNYKIKIPHPMTVADRELPYDKVRV